MHGSLDKSGKSDKGFSERWRIGFFAFPVLLAVALIGRFGLNPGEHYPSIILHYADLLADANLRSLVLLAAGYVALRFCEAYGLWHQRSWGEWLGALSGALYVPFELHHLVHQPSLASAMVLAINVGVVGYLAWLLWRERRAA